MTDIDPIEPTKIAPGLAAMSMAPTVWDDLPDGQHAVTPNGRVYQRRDGLWHTDPWWQDCAGAEVIAICADPDEWWFDMAWPRKAVEDAHGPLTPISLPVLPGAYPHGDEQCRQDSVDAACFTDVAQHLARLADALGINEPNADEIIDAAIRRIEGTDRG